MGFFNSTPSHPAPSEMTKKSGRKVCWDARDKLFGCLDKYNIEDAIKDDKLMKEKCFSENLEYEKSCVASWVEYFKLKRAQTFAKERQIAALEARGAKKIETASKTTVTEVKE